MKPSDFLHDDPYDSALQNSECETIARNIIVILKRTGDEFRELSFEEYKAEREKDKAFSQREKSYFDKVNPYCKDEESAKSFSNHWYKR